MANRIFFRTNDNKYIDLSKAMKPEDKVHKVMREFKEGKLKSNSGQLVTDRSQAVAIAMSESGMSKQMVADILIDYDTMSKAGKEPIGSVATWADGKQYRKVSEGVWKPDHSEKSRDAKLSGGAHGYGKHDVSTAPKLHKRFMDYLQNMSQEHRDLFRGGKFDFEKKTFTAQGGKIALLWKDDKVNIVKTDKMDKARTVKYIKRVPKPSGKGYYYFYTKQQFQEYKDKGIVPKEEKGGNFWDKVKSFFGANAEEKIDKLHKTVSEQGISVSKDSLAEHFAEYLSNKNKWDAKFRGEKKERGESKPKTESAKSEKKSGEKKEGKKWNNSLMKFFSDQYGMIGALKREEKSGSEKFKEAAEESRYNLQNLKSQKIVNFKGDDTDYHVVDSWEQDGIKLYRVVIDEKINQFNDTKNTEKREDLSEVIPASEFEDKKEKSDTITINQYSKWKDGTVTWTGSKKINSSELNSDKFKESGDYLWSTREPEEGDRDKSTGKIKDWQKYRESKDNFETMPEGDEKSKSISADQLFNIENEVMDKLDVSSGGEVRGDDKKAKEYAKAVFDSLDKKGVTKLSEKIHDKLEDQNYHLLNLVLSLGGYYGEKSQEDSLNFVNKMKAEGKEYYGFPISAIPSNKLFPDQKPSATEALKEELEKKDGKTKELKAPEVIIYGKIIDTSKVSTETNLTGFFDRPTMTFKQDGYFFLVDKESGIVLAQDKVKKNLYSSVEKQITDNKVDKARYESMIKEREDLKSKRKDEILNKDQREKEAKAKRDEERAKKDIEAKADAKRIEAEDRKKEKEKKDRENEKKTAQGRYDQAKRDIESFEKEEKKSDFSPEEWQAYLKEADDYPDSFSDEWLDKLKEYRENLKNLSKLKEDALDESGQGKMFKALSNLREELLIKAQTTKYIKRIPNPKGKGWIYFYTQEQVKAYNEKGIIPDQNQKKPEVEVKKEDKGNIEILKESVKKVASILADALSARDAVQPTGQAVEQTGENVAAKSKDKKRLEENKKKVETKPTKPEEKPNK